MSTNNCIQIVSGQLRQNWVNLRSCWASQIVVSCCWFQGGRTRHWGAKMFRWWNKSLSNIVKNKYGGEFTVVNSVTSYYTLIIPLYSATSWHHTIILKSYFASHAFFLSYKIYINDQSNTRKVSEIPPNWCLNIDWCPPQCNSFMANVFLFSFMSEYKLIFA